MYGATPLPKPMLTTYQWDPWEQTSVKIKCKFKVFNLKMLSAKCSPFCSDFPVEVTNYLEQPTKINHNYLMGPLLLTKVSLTRWGRVTHIHIIKPRQQAIISTNVGILSTGPWGRNFNEIFIKIRQYSFKKMHLKMSSGKWRPFCLWPQCANQHWD